MIIGVTGYFCSGKDTLAEMLQAKGCAHVSLSDMIRNELKRRKVKETIPNLTRVGNELRSESGPGILGQRALKSLDYSRNWVVTSIRHPAEVAALRSRPDFVMVFVDAPQKVRFERSLSRARKGDPTTFEAFAAEEKRQMSPKDGDPAAQALADCRKLADVRISNNTTLEAFAEKVTAFYKKALIEHFLPRPDWDEYFMMMAEVAATRGNCIKRRVGAVIVIDRQILSTGYNGTPKGITNCNDGGCPRCAGAVNSGSGLGECLCVHAEENAIVQAASHGVAIRGGTLYCILCPCSYCAKSIINASIREVVFRDDYAMDDITHKLFREAGVVCRQLKDPAMTVAPVYLRPAKSTAGKKKAATGTKAKTRSKKSAKK